MVKQLMSDEAFAGQQARACVRDIRTRFLAESSGPFTQPEVLDLHIDFEPTHSLVIAPVF